MTSLVYLTHRAPSEFTDQLTAAGYQVWEALSVSEVLHLCEHHEIHAVVIAAKRRDDAVLPIKLKQITISLEPHATAADLIWELEQFFPRKETPIQ